MVIGLAHCPFRICSSVDTRLFFFRGGAKRGGKKKPARRRVVLDDDDEEDSDFESVSVKKKAKILVK